MSLTIGQSTSPVLFQGADLSSGVDSREAREAFDTFVGETFFGQMLKSMRATVGEPAYFYGGRAEETFRTMLDQVLVEDMAAATKNQFSGPMYELFALSRPS